MNCVLLFLFFLSPAISFSQLDIKTVSFTTITEIPGEKHFSDTLEYEFLMKIIKKAKDQDTFMLTGLDCMWYYTHDTSYKKEVGDYTVAQNIHIGDFNGDQIDDCIIDFAVWMCYAYSCKVYLSKGNSYEIIKHKSGFITAIKFYNNQITEIQNKRHESPMYGFDFINSHEIKNGQPKLKFILEYMQKSDSLMKSAHTIYSVTTKKDSVNVYFGMDEIFRSENDYYHSFNYVLKNKKIQVLSEFNDWRLVIIEVMDKHNYEMGDLKPEKYYISAWMKKEDLE